MATIEQCRRIYRQQAMERGVNPRDVDLLIADLTGRPLPWLIAHGEEGVDEGQLLAKLERRFAGEPLQYIRGKTEFFSHEFVVDERVLIPRPETELLVEAAIARAPHGGCVVDIGTGSGCIAIALERARRDLQVIGVDLSIGALAVADLNRRRLGSRVALAASDLLGAIGGTIDLIVANPPYIPAADVGTLAVEVREHEPSMALTPGPRGTEIIERILTSAPAVPLLLEIGFGQEEEMRALADAHAFTIDTFLSDLAGIPRVVVLSPHGQ
jgi:release factor glutamine methyltransferase